MPPLLADGLVLPGWAPCGNCPHIRARHDRAVSGRCSNYVTQLDRHPAGHTVTVRKLCPCTGYQPRE